MIGLKGHIYRSDKQSPTNLQFIIDALSPKDTTKPPTRFDLKIYNIVLRRSSITYDVMSEPHLSDRFDANHIEVSNLRADIAIPRLKNDDFAIELKRLSLHERCGFTLSNIASSINIGKSALSLENLRIELPNSLVAIDSFNLSYSELKSLGRELSTTPINLDVANCYITPSDLAGFIPQLREFDTKINMTASIRGNMQELSVPVVSLTTEDNRFMLSMRGELRNLLDKDNIGFDLSHLDVKADANEIASITGNFTNLSPQADRIIKQCGNVRVNGSAKGSATRTKNNGDVNTSQPSEKLNPEFTRIPSPT